MAQMTWEEAVRWYRTQPASEAAVRDNYFDISVREAAERFSESEEFAEILRLLNRGKGRHLLDLGAGNGIASYALAKAGWQVTALEPDPSAEVGANAIRRLVAEASIPINVVEGWGEKLPFASETYAAVHARQVLHHAAELRGLVKEVARVLVPGGVLLATREHVVDNDEQLAAFRAGHPLHHLYGGENAFRLEEYKVAIQEAGLRLVETWGPWESILNYFPRSEAERQATVRRLARRTWFGLGCLLSWSAAFRGWRLRRFTRQDNAPGRLFSFLAEKPCES
jgi:SAM-dependent methyltransferase